MSVGSRIREIRERRGYSQKHLGELTGIHEVLIRRYEYGDRNPKTAQLQKIADALEVNINLLEESKLVSDMDIMFALFDLEKSRKGVKFEQKGHDIYINFGDFELNNLLLEWMNKKDELSKMDDDEAAKEYELWKMNYPDDVYRMENGKMVKVEKGNK